MRTGGTPISGNLHIHRIPQAHTGSTQVCLRIVWRWIWEYWHLDTRWMNAKKNLRTARKPAQRFDMFFMFSLCFCLLKTWELPHVYTRYVAILHRNSTGIWEKCILEVCNIHFLAPTAVKHTFFIDPSRIAVQNSYMFTIIMFVFRHSASTSFSCIPTCSPFGQWCCKQFHSCEDVSNVTWSMCNEVEKTWPT